ncbi:MAG: nucleoside deaminase [Desulfuromonas sp.]|nr:nucleoside deaminase [Desulfuromonas sp.]
MNHLSFSLQLPTWVTEIVGDTAYCPQPEQRMQLVLELVDRTIDERFGGPFAAAVFDQHSGLLISAAINLVLPCHCSSAHAEIVALSFAQQQLGQAILGQTDSGESDGHHYELVSSTEPCSMCLGAIPWSGVKRLTCAARDEDARLIGFDEGCKPQPWQHSLQQRGIEVVTDLLRPQAVRQLQRYAATSGVIYNGC